MNATLLYRMSSIVLLVFAAGHTAGFLDFQSTSAEGMAAYETMRSVHFDINGSMRTYANIYTGFGLTVTAYLLFCAYLAWHLGWLARTQPNCIGSLAWAFAGVQFVCFCLCIRYFFLAPVLFAGVVVLLLVLAGWRLSKRPA